jgi:malate synthase
MSHGHSAIDTIRAAVRKEAVSTNHEEPRDADGEHDPQDPDARSQRGRPAGPGRANARVAAPWACDRVTAGRDRLKFAPVEGAAALFPSAFANYLVRLHDAFTPRVHAIRAQRDAVLRRALEHGQQPAPLPPSTATTTSWQVPPVPDDLCKPGIEISGPCSITSMFINALNPGPEGERAEGDLDDDEDSGGHRFVDTVRAAHNRVAAVQRELRFLDAERNREYKIAEGDIPFFMHRERGLHLDEPDVTIDGAPVPAAILGTALTLFHAGRGQAERGQGIYFYLPKVEDVEDMRWYRDVFDASREQLPFLRTAVIRAIPLVESLPCVYQMEEMLHALGPYAAGLNAARWDLKASIFEYVMNDGLSVWPDRFGVDIKTTPFIANIFRRLVAICLKHGAVPIGGMATALPSNDPEVNRAAGEAIRKDKEWEAQQGFIRAWVAHIFHMKTAADPFRTLIASGWKPSEAMKNPDSFPVTIEVPAGPITVEGTRRNARMVVEYVEGWLNGRGAKGIDSLAGKPGIHPALMEDLATGRMSVAQIAQRIRHRARTTDGPADVHDVALVKRLLHEETEDILKRLSATVKTGDAKAQAASAQAETRYRQAVKIAMRWIKNYTDLDFRSLGSYTRADLERIAAAPDAF